MHKYIFLLFIFLSPLLFSKPFVIGRIDTNPIKTTIELQAMADYIANEIDRYTSGEVLAVKNYTELKAGMISGRIDWVTDTGLIAAKLESDGLARAVLLKWKKGQASYQSLLLVKKESIYRHIHDLTGKKVALEDPSSTSGYFVPMLMFKQYGIKVNMLERLNGTVSTDAINYVRFDDEEDSVFWLDKGLVEALATSSTDWDKKQRYADYYRSQFRVLQRSEDIPRAFEIASNKLPLSLVEKVKSIQLVMEKKAPDILKKYEGTTKFELLAPYHKKWLRNAVVKVKEGLSEK
jgi:phosphonate transport system substrate-binding protein